MATDIQGNRHMLADRRDLSVPEAADLIRVAVAGFDRPAPFWETTVQGDLVNVGDHPIIAIDLTL